MKKVLGLFKKTIALVVAVALLASLPSIKAEARYTSAGSIARGIDVSRYQGTINWAQVAASGVKFAFIRIGNTYGGLDPTFNYNIQQAQANGIKVGVYLYSYATTVEEATIEAQLTIAWLQNYGLQLPVAFDIEDKCHSKLDPTTIAAIVNTYCILIDSAGYYPMVYTYKNFYNTKIGATPWDIWMAQYNDACEVSVPIAFWQNSSSGSIPGISGRVDTDYQYKDYSTSIIKEGFLPHNGNTRFYSNWKMQVGWIDYQGKKYLADAIGNLLKGWYVDPTNNTYYFDMATGAAAIGETNITDYTFYFNEYGVQQFGFLDYGKGTKYFDPLMNGAMAKSWFNYNGTMHYADANGNQAIGITTIDKAMYYFAEDGSLVVNQTIEVNGKQYVADAAGVLTEVIPVAPSTEEVPEYIVDPNTGIALETATGNWVNYATKEIIMYANGTKPE